MFIRSFSVFVVSTLVIGFCLTGRSVNATGLCTSIGCRLVPSMAVACCGRYYECCYQYDLWLQSLVASDTTLEVLHQMAAGTIGNLYAFQAQARGKGMPYSVRR